MIQIVKNGNVAAILFTDSDFYLFNSGQIIVPLNSLSMVVDESDMATFRKASNNDLLFSAKISKITMGGTQLTKENAKTLFDSILAGPTGGGGFRFVSVETLPTTGENGIIYLVPEGEDSFVEYVWLSDKNRFEKLGFETDLTGYVTTEQLEESELVTSAALNDLNTRVIEVSASTSAVTSLSGDVQTLSGNVQTLSGNVQSLSATVTGNSSNIATLSATVSGNSSDIVTLSGNVTSISGQIGDIATALSNIVGE